MALNRQKLFSQIDWKTRAEHLLKKDDWRFLNSNERFGFIYPFFLFLILYFKFALIFNVVLEFVSVSSRMKIFVFLVYLSLFFPLGRWRIDGTATLFGPMPGSSPGPPWKVTRLPRFTLTTWHTLKEMVNFKSYNFKSLSTESLVFLSPLIWTGETLWFEIVA